MATKKNNRGTNIFNEIKKSDIRLRNERNRIDRKKTGA